jgi:hypothetical protein
MSGGPEEENAAARRRDGEGAPDEGRERPEGPGDDSAPPHWRDAHIPRYQGGTHTRMDQPVGDLPAGLILRGLSVVPFVIVGLLAFLAAVSLLVIVVFGSGGGQTLASWVRGRSGGQIAAGIMQLLGLELACGAVILLCWLALRYGFKERARAWFWATSTVVGAAGAALVIVVQLSDPHAYSSASIGGHDWLVGLALFLLMTVTSTLRWRRRCLSEDVDEA